MKKSLLILIMFPFICFSQKSNNDSLKVIQDDNKKIYGAGDMLRIIANRIPGSKVSGRGISIRGNQDVAELRQGLGEYYNGEQGGNSTVVGGTTVMWDVDGILYKEAPMIDVSQIVYLNLLKGLSQTNRYGQDGAAGVIVIRTKGSEDISRLEQNDPSNLWNTKPPMTKEERRALKAKKKELKAKKKLKRSSKNPK